MQENAFKPAGWPAPGMEQEIFETIKSMTVDHHLTGLAELQKCKQEERPKRQELRALQNKRIIVSEQAVPVTVDSGRLAFMDLR